MHSTLRFSAGKTPDGVKAVIVSQLQNNGGLLTNSSVFRADVESLYVDVSATRGSSTNDTPVSTHRPVSFTITHVRDKGKERGEESSGSTPATTAVTTEDATMMSKLFPDITKSGVMVEDAGTQGFIRFSTESSMAATTTNHVYEITTQPQTESAQTVSKYPVLEGTETMPPEGEETTHIVLSRGLITQQVSRHDETTQMVSPSEQTTRFFPLFTTGQLSDTLHTFTETTIESLPLTITTESEPEQSSTDATSVEPVSAEIYSTEYAPVAESPSVENVVTDSVNRDDISRSSSVWSAVTDSRIWSTITMSHIVHNAATESPRVDNAITDSPRVDNGTTERPYVDNTVTESPRVYNGTTESPRVDNGTTESPRVDNGTTESIRAVMESPYVGSDTTEPTRKGSAGTTSDLSQFTTAHSLISRQWTRFMAILNQTKDIATASPTSEMTLSAAENNFRTSKTSAREDGFDTTHNAEQTTTQARPTQMGDVDSTNDGLFTVTIESHTLTGTTNITIKSSNSKDSKIDF